MELRTATHSRDDYPDQIGPLLEPRFLRDPIQADPEGRYSRKICAVNGCPRISRLKELQLCKPHGSAFSKSKSDDWREWAAVAQEVMVHKDSFTTLGLFDVAAAGNKTVRDELAYGLQRRGLRRRATRPEIATRLARALKARGVRSLLDIRHDANVIEAIAHDCGGESKAVRSFLLDTLDEVCIAYDEEPTRRYLGIAAVGGNVFINLNSVENLEFRDAIVRWMTYRLNAESGTPTHIQSVGTWLMNFAMWLTERGIDTWAGVSRDVLLDYLAVINAMEKADGTRYAAKYRAKIVSGIGTFLEEAAVNGWVAIPSGAKWLRGEYPKVPKGLPRLIGKMNAARLRDPGNLQLVEDPDCRTAILIMASTGLRRKDVCAGITVDSVLDLGDGRWSLVYINSKAKEEKVIPISAELAERINAHIKYKVAKYPNSRMLFARNDADKVITLTIVNAELTKLIKLLELTDGSGKAVTITPHMFRHQNATEWLEKGMSLTAIRDLLGHSSMRTTEIYAHMTEAKVRDEWEQSLAVNGDGDLLYAPGSIEMEAAWTHAFMGGATQALPNGRCGMPCSEECEHANACLYCPLFITTPEYLPVLREQRSEHETMMKLAEEAGHQRIVERNRKPFFALSKLIAKLEKIEGQSQGE